MSKDKIESGSEAKNSRRSRKDEEGRNHICGCGKSYLSYPALFTHIKTKHDGVRPQGTFKDESINRVAISFNSNHLPKEDKLEISTNTFQNDGGQKGKQAKVQPGEFNVDGMAEVGLPKMKTPIKNSMEEKSKTLEESCQRETMSQNDAIADEAYEEENIGDVDRCLENNDLQENLNRKIDEEIDQYFS